MFRPISSLELYMSETRDNRIVWVTDVLVCISVCVCMCTIVILALPQPSICFDETY